jgi:CHASE2 domain-containing sensor protein
MSSPDNASGIVTLFVVFGLYLLPSIIAWRRRHHNGGAIFVLNLLLGWTGLGWIAAMIWSLTSPPPRPA